MCRCCWARGITLHIAALEELAVTSCERGFYGDLSPSKSSGLGIWQRKDRRFD